VPPPASSRPRCGASTQRSRKRPSGTAPRHCSRRCLIDRQTAPELDLHLILDNYAAHKAGAVKRWLARLPRFHVHFTPTSASWLNAVEGQFATLTKRRLKRDVPRRPRSPSRGRHGRKERSAAVPPRMRQHAFKETSMRAIVVPMFLGVMLCAGPGHTAERERPEAPAGPAPTRTGKERLGGKASDEQRVNDCKVPPERRTRPRPTACPGEVGS
jgi:transposase